MALVLNNAINGDTLGGGGSWTNPDGLTIYFGTQEAALASGGVYSDSESGMEVCDYIINLSALITANPTLVSRTFFPDNYIINKAEVLVETAAASSGTGTLGIGLWDFTAAATISDTAIISGMTTAILAAQSTITVIGAPAGSTAYGNTYAGANMGLLGYSWAQPPSAGAHALGITAKAGTAVFQSGIIRLKVYGYRSLSGDTTYSPGGQD